VETPAVEYSVGGRTVLRETGEHPMLAQSVVEEVPTFAVDRPVKPIFPQLAEVPVRCAIVERVEAVEGAGEPVFEGPKASVQGEIEPARAGGYPRLE
jgi:hypothetical protein